MADDDVGLRELLLRSSPHVHPCEVFSIPPADGLCDLATLCASTIPGSTGPTAMLARLHEVSETTASRALLQGMPRHQAAMPKVRRWPPLQQSPVDTF